MTPLRIAAAYLVIAGLWIALSDLLVEALVPLELQPGLGVVKGWGFVIVTGAALTVFLVRYERRIRSILDGSPNPILTVDRAGRIRFANPAAASAFRGELVGHAMNELVPADVAGRHAANIAAFLDDEPATVATHRRGVQARRLDGSSFPVAIELAALAREGRSEVVVTLIDLSERVAMERRLAQGERMETLGRFAGILAHDVRNYVTAIAWSAEVLADETPADDPRRPDLELIQRAVDEAREMISSVLEFARAAPATGRTDLDSHLARVTAVLERLLGDGVRLRVDAPDHLPAVAIAPAALTQVLVNLTTNARDAMPEGGTFSITARAIAATDDATGTEPAHVRIEVADTGTGMSPEAAAQAFEPFYTTKLEPGRFESGVGLGLASVALVVGRAGGRVDLQTELGGGTTFVLELPLAPPA